MALPTQQNTRNNYQENTTEIPQIKRVSLQNSNPEPLLVIPVSFD